MPGKLNIKPNIISVTTVVRSKLFAIETVDLTFSNGEKRQFERLIGSKGRIHAVMIAPMLDEDTVLLVREYGVGIEEYYLGLPKGIIEAGEDLLAAANREMMEEVGYGAHELIELKTTSAAPGYMARRMAFVLARDLYEHKLPGDEPEPLEVVPWRLSRLDELLKRDDFHESRSIAGLYMARDYLHGLS